MVNVNIVAKRIWIVLKRVQLIAMDRSRQALSDVDCYQDITNRSSLIVPFVPRAP